MVSTETVCGSIFVLPCRWGSACKDVWFPDPGLHSVCWDQTPSLWNSRHRPSFCNSSFPPSSINSHLERMSFSNASAILTCLFFRPQLALSTHSMVSQSFSHGPRLLYSNTIICVPLLAMLLVSNRYTVQIPHAVINHSWQNTLAAWQESTGTGSPAKLSPAVTIRIRVGVYFDGCYSSMICLP